MHERWHGTCAGASAHTHMHACTTQPLYAIIKPRTRPRCMRTSCRQGMHARTHAHALRRLPQAMRPTSTMTAFLTGAGVDGALSVSELASDGWNLCSSVWMRILPALTRSRLAGRSWSAGPGSCTPDTEDALLGCWVGRSRSAERLDASSSHLRLRMPSKAVAAHAMQHGGCGRAHAVRPCAPASDIVAAAAFLHGPAPRRPSADNRATGARRCDRQHRNRGGPRRRGWLPRARVGGGLGPDGTYDYATLVPEGAATSALRPTGAAYAAAIRGVRAAVSRALRTSAWLATPCISNQRRGVSSSLGRQQAATNPSGHRGTTGRGGRVGTFRRCGLSALRIVAVTEVEPCVRLRCACHARSGRQLLHTCEPPHTHKSAAARHSWAAPHAHNTGHAASNAPPGCRTGTAWRTTRRYELEEPPKRACEGRVGAEGGVGCACV
eukprot:309869-Chlamydomonas_euryale.AAC.3